MYLAILDDSGDMHVALSDMHILQNMPLDYLDSKRALIAGADIVVTYIDDLTPFQEAVAGVYDKYKQTALKPYIEALEAAKAKVGE